MTRGRRDIVVAVADDDFDMTHPDFQGEGKVVAQLNAAQISSGGVIQWDAHVQPRPGDYHGSPFSESPWWKETARASSESPTGVAW